MNKLERRLVGALFSTAALINCGPTSSSERDATQGTQPQNVSTRTEAPSTRRIEDIGAQIVREVINGNSDFIINSSLVELQAQYRSNPQQLVSKLAQFSDCRGVSFNYSRSQTLGDGSTALIYVFDRACIQAVGSNRKLQTIAIPIYNSGNNARMGNFLSVE